MSVLKTQQNYSGFMFTPDLIFVSIFGTNFNPILINTFEVQKCTFRVVFYQQVENNNPIIAIGPI